MYKFIDEQPAVSFYRSFIEARKKIITPLYSVHWIVLSDMNIFYDKNIFKKLYNETYWTCNDFLDNTWLTNFNHPINRQAADIAVYSI